MLARNSRHVLWHYTDAAGLHGILQNGTLRFGDARFLNDRTERDYGLNVVREAVRLAAVRGDRKGMLVTALELIAPPFTADRVSIFSLSETPESLSQWQRYGADGFGYCIGFDAGTFTDDLLQPLSLSLLKVVYSRDEQLRLARERIAQERRTLRRAKDYQSAKWEAAHLAFDLGELALQFKHPSFADEHEWRLILRVTEPHLGYSAPDPQFAHRANYIKPYIDLHLPWSDKPGAPLLPVSVILCGPRLDAQMACLSIRVFLDASGYGPVTVARSALAETWR